MKVLRQITLWIVLVSMLSVKAGCAPSAQLASPYEAGSRYSQRVEIESDIKISFAPKADYQKSNMVLDYQVVGVDEQGLVTVEVTIAELKAEGQSLQFKFAYDSSSDKGPETAGKIEDAKEKKYYQAFTGLVGKKYTAQMDKSWGEVKLLNIDPRIKQASAGQAKNQMIGGDQAAVLLAESNLKDYVRPAVFAGVKAEDLKVDQTWLGKEAVRIPRSEGMSQCEYKVEAIEPSESKQTVAKIAYQISEVGSEVASSDPADKEKKPQAAAAQAGGFIMATIKGSGTIQYSITGQRIFSLKESMSVGIRTAQTRAQKSDKPKIFYVLRRTMEFIDKTDDTNNTNDKNKTDSTSDTGPKDEK